MHTSLSCSAAKASGTTSEAIASATTTAAIPTRQTIRLTVGIASCPAVEAATSPAKTKRPEERAEVAAQCAVLQEHTMTHGKVAVGGEQRASQTSTASTATAKRWAPVGLACEIRCEG